ncbi:hypothetical protein [Streptomyces sp. CB02923]|nr:hypothetical protein [Streptomyces sp. CB02923]
MPACEVALYRSATSTLERLGVQVLTIDTNVLTPRRQPPGSPAP